MTLSLTTQQLEAFRNIRDFLETPDVPAFILTGYAGTGKTFLVKKILDYVLSEKKAVYLMAPTGRAARILSDKTGNIATTVHRGIYQFEKEELDTIDAYQIFFRIAENKAPDHSVYIIDEASMVSDVAANQEIMKFGSGRLLHDLISFCNLTTTNRKIIFCGDPAQLPPVGMSTSPALNAGYLKSTFGLQAREAELSEIVRQQAGNSILALASNLRDQISMKYPDRVHICADGRDVGERPLSDLRNDFAATLREYLFPETVWICHTNKASDMVNKDIRNCLGLFQGMVQDNELLLVTQNNYANDILLMNGDLVRVSEASDLVEKFEVVFNYRDKKGVRKKLLFRDISIVHPSNPGQPLRIKLLENSLTDPESNLLNTAMFVLCRKQYEPVKNSIDFDSFKNKNPYMKALHARYGYAITCHKAQGGEWEQVIADFKHASGKYNKAFLQWAYTGVTRAKRKLWVVNPVYADALSGYVVRGITTLKRMRSAVPLDEEVIIEDDDPALFHTFPFLKVLHLKLQSAAESSGVDAEIKLLNYRVRVTLSKNNSDSVWDITYSQKGLNPVPVLLKSSSDEFARAARQLVEAALSTDAQPVDTSGEASRAMMHTLLEGICDKLNIRITGFLIEEWRDIWLLHTDQPGSQLACYYDKNKRYTSIEPGSLTGGNDLKLTQLVRELSNR